MQTGRYDGLTGAKRYEVYIIVLMVIGGMIGAFFLGSWTTTNNTRVISQQIYDQGFTAGEASGMHRMQLQCAGELLALRDNCEAWTVPNMRFGNVNLTGNGKAGV